MSLEIENRKIIQVNIRAMIKNDLADVILLERNIFPDPWSYEAFEEQIEIEGWGGLVAEWNGRIIGYACYYIVNDEAHLTNIAVDSNYRRKSVAKQLLENILKVVMERNCEFILLEVRPNNKNAITFYEKYGFNVLYRRPNYYRKPIEDALVMVRYLS